MTEVTTQPPGALAGRQKTYSLCGTPWAEDSPAARGVWARVLLELRVRRAALGEQAHTQSLFACGTADRIFVTQAENRLHEDHIVRSRGDLSRLSMDSADDMGQHQCGVEGDRGGVTENRWGIPGRVRRPSFPQYEDLL